MRVALSFLLIVAVMGCAGSKEAENRSSQPALLKTVPLPAITSKTSSAGMQLNALFHIMNDGAVSNVKLLGSSGDAEWDSLACLSMMRWRFAREPRGTQPSERWVRYSVVVREQTREPMVLMLGAISASSAHESDSLYTMLAGGVEFDQLARDVYGVAKGDRDGFLGAVDITLYPTQVREALEQLHENEISHPIKVGDRYVIYKRFPDNIVRNLP
jgi:hypothetical protein